MLCNTFRTPYCVVPRSIRKWKRESLEVFTNVSIQPNVFSDTGKHHYFHNKEAKLILNRHFNFYTTSTTVSKDIFANFFPKIKVLKISQNLTQIKEEKYLSSSIKD
jgi:hypothetical protein